jgi:ABC-type transport system substrate-binding protein
MSFIQWDADYPTPENWLPFFATDNRFSGGDTGGPELDQLIARAAAEPDDTRRAALWAQIQQAVVDGADGIFLFHQDRAVLARHNLAGLSFGQMDSSALPGYRSYASTTVEKRP